MSITVGDVLRVVAIMQWLDGDIAMNVFNAVISGTGGPYDDLDIVDDAVAWLDLIYGEITAQVSTDLDGAEVRVYIYDTVDDDWDEVGSDVWTWNPTSAGEPLPRGVAALVNVKTLDPDVNGKKYYPGMTEAGSTDGLWGAGTVTDLQDSSTEWVGTFAGAVSGADWVPGIWSPTRTNFYPFSGTIIVPTIPAYQRRRKNGIGI